MGFYHDDGLDKLAKQKCDAGCRKQLKGMAARYIHTGIGPEMIESMEFARNQGYLKPDLDVTYVLINQGLLVFNELVESVKCKINNVNKADKVPTPRKVLVKMCAIRINRIRRLYEGYNKYSKDASRHTSISAGVVPLYEVPEDVNTTAKLKHAYEHGKRSLSYHWMVSGQCKAFEQFLNSPELTDQIVSEAWDLVLTGSVLSE